METKPISFTIGEYISALGLTKVEITKTNGTTYCVEVFRKGKKDEDGFTSINSNLMNAQDILELLMDDPEDELEVKDTNRFKSLYEEITKAEPENGELEVVFEPEEEVTEESTINYGEHILSRFNDLEFKIHTNDLHLQNMHERLNEIKSLILEMFQEED